jgi:exopolyphosphatase/guanosine-5'-triphosphate,3'-diphosphate pyrophosphatase
LAVHPPTGWRGRKGKETGRWPHVYSAIDLGTNNCRLLVARPTSRGFRVIDAYSRIVRLGEGVISTGRLADPAVERTIEALKICADKMARRGVTRGRAIATAACRNAQNCDEFVERVKRETGLCLDIISTAEEARLAVAGCHTLFEERAGYGLVFDIGGGSTELIWVRHDGGRATASPEIVAWTSLPCGVVSLSEKFGGREVAPETYRAMVDHVLALMASFRLHYDFSGEEHGGDIQILGTSGTVTTLAGLYLNLKRYDRSKVDGLSITTEELHRLSGAVAGMSIAERIASPCIGPDRADLVIGGCAILEAIYRTWPSERIRVADRGLREGILMGLIEEADSEGHFD